MNIFKRVVTLVAGITLLFVFTACPLKSSQRSVAMVCISTPNRTNFSQYTLNSLVGYAAHWGYDFCFYSAPFDPSRHPSWNKILALKHLMEQGKHEWYVWVDDDIFITNPSIPLQYFIQEYGTEADFIISAHKEKPESDSDVNAGLFFLRNSQWSRDFLKQIWDIGNYRYFTTQGSFLEQSAIIELLGTEKFKDSKLVKRVPARIIQSFITLVEKDDKGDYGQWQPGDFAAHMAAVDDKLREYLGACFTGNSFEYPTLPDIFQRYTIKQ